MPTTSFKASDEDSKSLRSDTGTTEAVLSKDWRGRGPRDQRSAVIRVISGLVCRGGTRITKSFWSSVDKTVRSIQEDVEQKIWLPRNEDFCSSFQRRNRKRVDSTRVEKDGFSQIVNVFRKASRSRTKRP